MNKITRFIGLFTLVAVTLLWPISNASAALSRCRTDPIFFLSNGDVINITVDINTDPVNIRNINYVLHVPAGVTVKRVTYTAINLGLPETFQVYQDSLARTYTTATIVTTRRMYQAEVLSMTRLNSVFAKYVSGYIGEKLIVTVSADEAVGWIQSQ